MEGKPTGNTFRPPPGFMDDVPNQDAAPTDNPQVRNRPHHTRCHYMCSSSAKRHLGSAILCWSGQKDTSPRGVLDRPRLLSGSCNFVQEMLQRVRGGIGHWHELAKLLPVLGAAGYDGLMVEQEAGVERATQNRWTVSMHVSPLSESCLMPLVCEAVGDLSLWV